MIEHGQVDRLAGALHQRCQRVDALVRLVSAVLHRLLDPTEGEVLHPADLADALDRANAQILDNQWLGTLLETGMVGLNQGLISNAAAPFGGVKHSGYGRECSAFGIREFTNIKTIWMEAVALLFAPS